MTSSKSSITSNSTASNHHLANTGDRPSVPDADGGLERRSAQKVVVTHLETEQPLGPSEGKGEINVATPAVDTSLPLKKRPAEALRGATEVFAMTGYWVSFYRAVLGPNGLVAQLFPEDEEMGYFCTTREFDEIQKMLTALRTSDEEKAEIVEAVSVITLRLPRSMHVSLGNEAKRRSTSLNKLCISKLLLPAPKEYVPREKGRVRGRKPKSH